MKTPNHLTPTSNPSNKGLKPSDSHLQPNIKRRQTVQRSRPTHGTTNTNKHPPPNNPPYEDLKILSNSHIQPMEQRPQTIRLSHPTHGTKASNHPTLTS